MPDSSLEEFKHYLPKYLSPETKEELYQTLRDFPNRREVYARTRAVLDIASPLQGDGWRGFVAINFETLERKTVSGIILSNSCDIDSENARSAPVRVLFAPLLSLDRYAALLSQGGRSPAAIQDTLNAIREQKMTSIFYVPTPPGLQGEWMVLLDNVHSHPLNDFLGRERSLLFRLNNFGFYLFLFKLSLHLMRFQEGIDRQQ